MITDPLRVRALELLTRGHHLYPDDAVVAGPANTPQRLTDHADRLASTVAHQGIGAASPQIRRTVADLRAAAGTDTRWAGLFGQAHADRELGWHATRAVLLDALNDSLPAADTALGRREALRRTAARLTAQRRHVLRSRRRSARLTRRLRRLGYPHRRSREIPIGAVRYDTSVAAGHVRGYIATALDCLGISDAAARRSWLRGYQTLIARESGGRPWAVAGESTGFGYARGLTQTIPATFALYHQPGTSTNIYDPVANICASMNYVMQRYGVSADGANLIALVRQADSRRPPEGY